MPGHSIRFDAIGTNWQIDSSVPLGSHLVSKIDQRIADFDAVYSRFRSDSVVSQASHHAGAYRFPDDSLKLFDFYDELYSLTEGAVTPLIGASLEHLGYDREYSLIGREGVVVPLSWSEAVNRDGSTLTLHQEAMIDVGAAGKGYLVDLVVELIRESGLSSFTVDASGDLFHAGSEPIRVGLEHPFDPTKAIGVVSLDNEAICASGSNRRRWGEGVHHILDGRTGKPVADVIATWAVASSALVADGLATALFFVSPDVLRDRFDFSWVRLFHNGTAEWSESLSGEVFS